MNPLTIEIQVHKEYWDHQLCLNGLLIHTNWAPIDQQDLDWYVQTQLMNQGFWKDRVYNVLKWGKDLLANKQ